VLVFGDAAHSQAADAKLAAIADRLGETGTSDIRAHAALVAAFIEASELAQGVADAEFEAAGRDVDSPARGATMDLLMELGRLLHRSWHRRFKVGQVRETRRILARLREMSVPSPIRCKQPEGYAFYAVYPECYLQAGAALRRGGSTRVIGIRSIGVGLGALVAVAARAPPPVTVRPVGHPFRRHLALGADLAAQLLVGKPAQFVVVDEGPGLSGSSFGAVADFLEQNGVDRQRIHFVPSHAGEPGPQASAMHRQRWRAARRHVVDFDALALRNDTPGRALTDWVVDVTGPPAAPLEDLSGGQWRCLRFSRAADWPPAHGFQEHRKFLLRNSSGSWLLKFAGLGRYGEAKLARGRALSQAGFTPEVVALRHGFLVERWLEVARPLDPRAVGRDVLLQHLASYLGFRAVHFPVAADRGAAMHVLLSMLERNATVAFGCKAAQPVTRLARHGQLLDRRIRRVATDNRMHAWEWLLLPDGRLVKTDALDHSAAHDLIGCQDIAWDVVGAAVELQLSRPERDELCGRVARISGQSLDAELLDVLTACYLAFELGYYTLAAQALPAGADELARLQTQAARYKASLSAHLQFVA